MTVNICIELYIISVDVTHLYYTIDATAQISITIYMQVSLDIHVVSKQCVQCD